VVKTPVERRVLLAGASGLVGRALLDDLLSDEGTQVCALLRREVPGLPASTRLMNRLIDFAAPEPLPAADELYVALGTTIKVAGSPSAFRAVDFDSVVNVARAAHLCGVRRVAVVSALGADSQSRVFYNRVKGEMEEALMALGFERLVIARPSLLSGARTTLGQAPRIGERLALAVLAPIRNLVPAGVRPIDAAVVARAMRIALRQNGPAIQVIDSAGLQTLGKGA
jgi:uncharacterized protein YbjT (DUF2867 family)